MFAYWSVLWHLGRTGRRLLSPCDREVCIEAIENWHPRRRRICKSGAIGRARQITCQRSRKLLLNHLDSTRIWASSFQNCVYVPWTFSPFVLLIVKKYMYRGWVPFATNGRTSQTLKVLSIEFDKTYEPQFESDKEVTVSLCPFMFVQTLTEVKPPSFTARIIPAWFFGRKSWQHYQFRRKWLDRRCRWTSQMSFGSDTSSRRWILFFACPKFLLSNRLMLKQQADLLFVQHVRHWRFPGALKRNC